MRYILAIDDTDNLDSPGTGEHLENITAQIEALKLGDCSRITRHQLFFSPLVKYTSHNSSMAACIQTETSEPRIFDLACEYLAQNAAEGSDPGVCLLNPERLSDGDKQQLRAYGLKSKSAYVEKKEAYDLAGQAGILLKEIGGEGIGVIGALAGAALRLDGNDGRYKGKFDFGINQDNMRCRDILSHPYIDCIMTEDGQMLSGDTEIFIVDQIKTVYKDHQSVLLVKQKQTPNGEEYVNLSRHELKKY